MQRLKFARRTVRTAAKNILGQTLTITSQKLRRAESKLSLEEHQQLQQLREQGYCTFTHLVNSSRLSAIQARYKKLLEDDLDFETPCLGQNLIDPQCHAEVIEKKFKYLNAELKAMKLCFDQDDIGQGNYNYAQILERFNPPTLKTYLPSEELFFSTWLDERLLNLIEAYMGFMPIMREAYLRRNFPTNYRVMNHCWHRDTNHSEHLLKAFFFFSDCTSQSGPHHYISGSVHDQRLSGGGYFDDEQVHALYPIGSSKHITSEVPAGTIILEDTRGLHKAGIPKKGYRYLGYAVFMPKRMFSTPLYAIDKMTRRALNKRQQRYIWANTI